MASDKKRKRADEAGAAGHKKKRKPAEEEPIRVSKVIIPKVSPPIISTVSLSNSFEDSSC